MATQTPTRVALTVHGVGYGVATPPDLAVPHLDHIDAVAHRRGGQRTDDLVGVAASHGLEGGGGAPVAVAVAGQPRVGPVLDRVPEEEDEAGDALEGDPQPEDDSQPAVGRRGGVMPRDESSARGSLLRDGAVTSNFAPLNES